MESGGWSWEEKRKRIAQILETIANDNTAPRNLRKAVKGAMDELFNERYSPSVRAANAIELIEDVLSDGNIPSYTRTQLWLAISLLETVKAGHY